MTVWSGSGISAYSRMQMLVWIPGLLPYMVVVTRPYSGLPSKIGSIVTGLVTKPSRIRLRILPAGEHSTGWGLFEGRPFGSLNDSLSGVGLVIGTCVLVRHRVHSACVNASVFFARECCWNDG